MTVAPLRRRPTVGDRYRDRDERTGVRVVEVVDVQPPGRYALIRRVYPPGVPAQGTGSRTTRILTASLMARWDWQDPGAPTDPAPAAPAPRRAPVDVDALVQVAVTAWRSQEALTVERDAYRAERGRSFTHARDAAEVARITYALRAALTHPGALR